MNSNRRKIGPNRTTTGTLISIVNELQQQTTVHKNHAETNKKIRLREIKIRIRGNQTHPNQNKRNKKSKTLKPSDFGALGGLL